MRIRNGLENERLAKNGVKDNDPMNVGLHCICIREWNSWKWIVRLLLNPLGSKGFKGMWTNASARG